MTLFIIYIIGMVAGFLLALYLIANWKRSLTLRDIGMSLLVGAFSWVSTLIFLIEWLNECVDWDKKIWEKKTARKEDTPCQE